MDKKPRKCGASFLTRRNAGCTYRSFIDSISIDESIKEIVSNSLGNDCLTHRGLGRAWRQLLLSRPGAPSGIFRVASCTGRRWFDEGKPRSRHPSCFLFSTSRE
jgi:hypothetical protein